MYSIIAITYPCLHPSYSHSTAITLKIEVSAPDGLTCSNSLSTEVIFIGKLGPQNTLGLTNQLLEIPLWKHF